MTAWTTISNALVAVGAKPFATTIQALRDNLAATAEGASGAPRIWLPALERLVVGSTIKLRADAAVLVSTTTFTVVPGFIIDTIQAGTIRVTFEHRRNTNASEVRLLRRRAGVNTAFGTVSTTSTTFVADSIDLDVQPGDRIQVQHRNTGGTDSEIRNVRLTLDAACYFWPVGSSFGEVEGNTTVTSP
jgi:hypothetical protein